MSGPTQCRINIFLFIFIIMAEKPAHPIIIPVSHLSPIIESEYAVTDAAKYPFMVRIFSKPTSHQLQHLECGGVIISLTEILTAAHCIYNNDTNSFQPPEMFRIVAGCIRPIFLDFETNQFKENGDLCQFVNVTGFRRHENYKHNKLENDIAILQLSSALIPSPTVSLAKLPSPGFIPHGVATLIGYGCTQSPICDNGKLFQVQVPIADRQTCKSSWPNIFNDKQFCTNSKLAGGCNGDSGSPLICKDKNGLELVCGILSFGGVYCIKAEADVYADLSKYTDLLFAFPYGHTSSNDLTVGIDKVEQSIWAFRVICKMIFAIQVFAFAGFVYAIHLLIRTNDKESVFGAVLLASFSFTIGFSVGFLKCVHHECD